MRKIADLIGEKEEEIIRKCIVCGKENQHTICYDCVCMTIEYNKLREYINELEEVNENLVYLLHFSINDRLSLIINYIKIDTELIIGEKEEVDGEILENEFIGVKSIFTPKKNSDYVLKKLWEVEQLKVGKKMIENMLKGKN